MRLELTLLLLTCNTLQRCRCACNPRKHRITASPPRKRLDKRACRELALPQHLRSLALARTHYYYALLSHVACVWYALDFDVLRSRVSATLTCGAYPLSGGGISCRCSKCSCRCADASVSTNHLARARTHMQHARMSSTSVHACARTQIPLSSNLKDFTAATIPRPHSTVVFSHRLLTTEKAFGIKPKA